MDERVAGRVSWDFLRLLLVLIPVAWRTLPAAGVLKVEMAEETQTVFLNDNATISCKVSGSSHLDINIMGITWFRESLNETEVKVFEFFGNHQEAFGSGAIVSLSGLKTGDASLQLFGIQLREAGRYRCEMVVTPEKAQGTVCLKVVASPVSVLFQDPATVKDNEDKYILCKSSGFYPKDINITWNKWTQEDPQYLEISEGITTGPIVKNKDGTFNVTSRLRLKPSLDHNMTVYQCVVRHISLPTSQRFNFTLPGIESEKSTGVRIIVICIGSILVIGLILGLGYFFWKRVCHRNRTLDNDVY